MSDFFLICISLKFSCVWKCFLSSKPNVAVSWSSVIYFLELTRFIGYEDYSAEPSKIKHNLFIKTFISTYFKNVSTGD